MIDLTEYAGFEVRLDGQALRLGFGSGVVTAPVSVRRVAEVRPALRDPDANGPDPLYSIYMDIRVPLVTEALAARGLGYGAVVFNHGSLGGEAVRSQGHVHSVSAATGVAYSELYEVWHGRGLVYMQDAASSDLTDVIVVEAGPGDKVAIPPGWAHATANLGNGPLVFGAVYALEARLLYDPLRALRGMAHYLLADGSLEPNPRYPRVPPARCCAPHRLREQGLEGGRPALLADASRLDFVSHPERHPDLWRRLIAGEAAAERA